MDDDSLDIEIWALLDGRKGEWRAIAEASGVSYSWVCKFARGRISNPGFALLKRLHAQLQESPPMLVGGSASAAKPRAKRRKPPPDMPLVSTMVDAQTEPAT